MLESYCVKAKLEDGMDVLDLGCGWGSLTLFLAKVSALGSSWRSVVADPGLGRNTPTRGSPPSPIRRPRSSISTRKLPHEV